MEIKTINLNTLKSFLKGDENRRVSVLTAWDRLPYQMEAPGIFPLMDFGPPPLKSVQNSNYSVYRYSSARIVLKLAVFDLLLELKKRGKKRKDRN